MVCLIGVPIASAVITGDRCTCELPRQQLQPPALKIAGDSMKDRGRQQERAHSSHNKCSNSAGALMCSLQGAEGAWAVREGTAAL